MSFPQIWYNKSSDDIFLLGFQLSESSPCRCEGPTLVYARQNLQTSHSFLHAGTKMNHLQGIIPAKTAPLPCRLPSSLDEVASPWLKSATSAGARYSAPSQCVAPRHPAHIPRRARDSPAEWLLTRKGTCSHPRNCKDQSSYSNEAGQRDITVLESEVWGKLA